MNNSFCITVIFRGGEIKTRYIAGDLNKAKEEAQEIMIKGLMISDTVESNDDVSIEYFSPNSIRLIKISQVGANV